MRGLIISGDGFEDLELFYPLFRLREKDIEITLASPESGEIEGIHGYTANVDEDIEEIDPVDYDFLILPGGRAPKKLGKNERVLSIVRSFYEQDKIIAAVCHGPRILISAGIMKGKTATSYPRIKDELIEGGVNYVDEKVASDGNILTTRRPEDFPSFFKEFFRKLKME